ncbi:hypothetical protein NXH67_14295 [Butyrivibrio sp. DSM 10294]|uniref:hypothetical protein n=1 Tax=Butyrivibrio sp. DSM 10294 TaxID=2972457 RepID=UPI00234F13CE|nr:hypothetical protein [Butyrivibrio sp. DSM 10294]MDC7294685.1 hypothetical protein [Butyrivibrio sp. DSM 10294]
MGYVSALDSSKLVFLQKFNSIGFRTDSDSISTIGFMDGYRFTISMEGFDYLISTSVRSGGLLPEDRFLENIVGSISTIKTAAFQNNRITFKLKKRFVAKKLVDDIISTMHSLAAIFRQSGYINVCEICGEPVEGIESYDINGRVFDLCDNCHESCNSYVEARRCLDDSIRENFAKGIGLSLLYGIFAAALIVLLMKYGVVSPYTGAMVGFLLICGYEQGSGKMSKFGLIYCSAAAAVLTYLSCRIGYSLAFVSDFAEMGEKVSFADIFTGLEGVLRRYNLTKDFYEIFIYYFLVSMVFIGIDIIFMVNKRKIKKMDVIIEVPEEDRFYSAG